MLYAKWTPKVLKITLNKNGGSDGTSTIYQKYNTGWYSNAGGTTSISSITKPTQTGKTFDGYFTLPTGGTKIIGEDGKIINGYASTFIEDGDLYAHWTTNTYTVVYNGNTNTGGSTSSSTHTYGVSKALTKNGFIKTNYAFTGWATSASGNVVYTDEEVVKNLTTTQNGTVSLFAKWSQCTNGEGVHAWENGCTIASCAAGYYKDGNTCKYCSAGTNTTAGNTASSCTTCSNSSSVATYSSLCVASTCKAGYYKDGNTCKACSAGTITSEGNVSASCSTCSNSSSVAIYTSLCVANTCKAGYYKNGTTCSACAAGTTTTEGNTSTSCDACTNNTGVNSYSSLCIIANCKAGYYKSGNSCVACASGTYTDSVNTASSCTACPGGKTNTAGSSSCPTNCSNSSGVNSWGDSCTVSTCAADFYKNGNACTECGGGKTTTAGNTSTSCSNCSNSSGVNAWSGNGCTVSTCAANFYKNGNACTACAAGTTTTAGNTSTSCSTCSNATGVNSWSGNGCTVANCKAGYYKSGNSCVACSAGTYTDSVNTASSCTACPGGKTNTAGSSSCPTNCSNSSGVNSWGNSCTVNTCQANFYKNGNACTGCEGGKTTSAGNTATSCSNCSNSSGVNAWSGNGCTVNTCQANFYKNGNACTGCGGGKTTSAGNTSTSCNNCTNTTGVASWSGNGCTVSTCQANYYKNGNACTGCGGGKTTSAGNTSTSCSNCTNTTGVYAWSGNGCTIASCAAGYYKDGNTCKACAAGTTTSAGNTSTSCTTCSNNAHVATWSSGCNINTCNSGYLKTSNKCLTPCEHFAAASWSEIASNVNSNLSIYPIGCTRSVTLGSSLGTHTLRVANNTRPSACNTSGFSQTACGFVVEFEDIIKTHRMNPSTNGASNGDGTKGGWEYSEMRTYVNNDIYNALPSELKSAIIDTTVVSSHGSNDSANFTTTDKLYLLSTKEVYGKEGTSNVINYDTAEAETRQLDYYKAKGVTTVSGTYSPAIKKYVSIGYRWWLRSARSNSTGNFFTVNSNGYWDYYGSIDTYGVSPAFRIR